MSNYKRFLSVGLSRSMQLFAKVISFSFKPNNRDLQLLFFCHFLGIGIATILLLTMVVITVRAHELKPRSVTLTHVQSVSIVTKNAHWPAPLLQLDEEIALDPC